MAGIYMNHNFLIGPTDTDSISFCKPDMSPFSKEEIDFLIKELNSISPEFMVWENDGLYDTCLVIRAKNYILKEYGTGKITIKGSAFKDQKKEQALQQLMKDLVYYILDHGINHEDLSTIYHKYIEEVKFGVQDIKPWCSKKTITSKILKCAGHEDMTKEEKKELGIRKNETDVWDAVKNIHTQEGNKVYLYPVKLPDEIETGRVGKNGKPLKDKVHARNGLRLAEEWTPGDEDKHKLLERIHSTVLILDTILEMSYFNNYSLEDNTR
jgi:hypothetical protein